MSSPISAKQVQRNALVLWEFIHFEETKDKILHVKGDQLATISRSNFIGRLWFWIIRWSEKETSVEAVVLKTLEKMSQQLNQENPRFHFKVFDDLDLRPYGETYDKLAQKIINHSYFNQKIKEKAQDIFDKMQALEPIKDTAVKEKLEQSKLNPLRSIQDLIQEIVKQKYDYIEDKETSLDPTIFKDIKAGIAPDLIWRNYFKLDLKPGIHPPRLFGKKNPRSANDADI